MQTTIAKKCPECGLEVTISRAVFSGRRETTTYKSSREFAQLCAHKDEDNGPYDCRVLQAAIDASD
jgi:hypothetical protein